MLVNYDSPLMSGGNYYLALHPKTRKILFLPWDLNETFGGFMAGPSPELMSVRQPTAARQFMLADRLLAIPAMRTRYEASSAPWSRRTSPPRAWAGKSPRDRPFCATRLPATR